MHDDEAGGEQDDADAYGDVHVDMLMAIDQFLQRATEIALSEAAVRSYPVVVLWWSVKESFPRAIPQLTADRSTSFCGR